MPQGQMSCKSRAGGNPLVTEHFGVCKPVQLPALCRGSHDMNRAHHLLYLGPGDWAERPGLRPRGRRLDAAEQRWRS